MRASTPGPWTLSDPESHQSDDECCVTTSEAEVGKRWYVATAHGFGDNGETSKANALLIAGSPALLETLKNAVARLCRVDGGDSITVSNALDAIHEATGEDFDVEAFIAEEDAKEASAPCEGGCSLWNCGREKGHAGPCQPAATVAAGALSRDAVVERLTLIAGLEPLITVRVERSDLVEVLRRLAVAEGRGDL